MTECDSAGRWPPNRRRRLTLPAIAQLAVEVALSSRPPGSQLDAERAQPPAPKHNQPASVAQIRLAVVLAVSRFSKPVILGWNISGWNLGEGSQTRSSSRLSMTIVIPVAHRSCSMCHEGALVLEATSTTVEKIRTSEDRVDPHSWLPINDHQTSMPPKCTSKQW